MDIILDFGISFAYHSNGDGELKRRSRINGKGRQPRLKEGQVAPGVAGYQFFLVL